MKKLLGFSALVLLISSYAIGSGIFNPGSGSGGGGGGFPLETLFSVVRSSPTKTLKGSTDFTGVVTAASTMTFSLSQTNTGINTFTSSITINGAGFAATNAGPWNPALIQSTVWPVLYMDENQANVPQGQIVFSVLTSTKAILGFNNQLFSIQTSTQTDATKIVDRLAVGTGAGSSVSINSVGGGATFVGGSLAISSNTVLAGTTFYQNGNVTIGTAGTVTLISSNAFIAGTTFYQANGLSATRIVDTELASGQCVQTGTGGLLSVTGSACGAGGGGGSFSAAVGTGTAAGVGPFAEPLTSTSTIRLILLFDSSTFNTSFTPGGTTYVTPKSSSFTLQGVITAASLGATTLASFSATQPIKYDGAGVFSATGISISTGLTGNTFSQSSFTVLNAVGLGGAGFTTTISSNAFIGGSTFYQAAGVAMGGPGATVAISSNAFIGGSTFYQGGSVVMGGPAASVKISSNAFISGATFYQGGNVSIGGVGAVLVVSSNAFIAGSTFYQGGSVSMGGPGAGVAISSNAIIGGTTFYQASGISGQNLYLINAAATNSIQTSSAPTGVTLFSVSSAPAVVARDFLLLVSSSNSPATVIPVFGIQNNGHTVSSGTTPSITVTGGSGPSLHADSTDEIGRFTWGGVATGACITFKNVYGTAPFCIGVSTAGAVGSTQWDTTSSSFSFSGNTGGTITYRCGGGKGG